VPVAHSEASVPGPHLPPPKRSTARLRKELFWGWMGPCHFSRWVSASTR